MSSPLVVALDAGTSSVRAIAFDATGRTVGEAAQIPYEQRTTPEGGVETEAPFLLELLTRCLDSLAPTLKGEVVAVGFSCFWHSLLGVGRDGKPLTPLFSWADNRAAAWIPTLRAQMDEPTTHARLGCVFHTSYWPAKILWLRDARPDLFACDAADVTWMGFGEWARSQLCGNGNSSLSMASGTGLFDQNRCDWDEEILSHLPLEKSQLPALCDADEPAQLKPEWAARWPQLAKAKWFPALGDGACSNVGSGCANAQKIALNAGTSGALRVVLRDFEDAAPRGLWRYRLDRQRSLVGGALSNAGNVLAWARETLQLPSDWPTRVGEMTPDTHGLTILPFLAGERAPIWNGAARLVVEGASWNTRPETLVRAILEAAALRFAEVGRRLLELAPGAEIVFSGGALEKVPVWQPIVCDALGAPLTQSREHEASARGAALMALEALGLLDDVQNAPFERGAQLEPTHENLAIYGRALERQNALYDKIYG